MISTPDKPAVIQTRWQWIMRLVKRFAIVSVAIYIGFLALLIWFETELVYPGSKFPRGNWQPTNFAFEEIEFESTDGTKLVGWFLPRHETATFSPSDTTTTETVLLCHGNAENAAQSSAYIGDMLRSTLNADVFVFDYRGYGKSDGTPAEAGILQDAESAHRWLMERTGKSSTDITLVGHSIGGGPAVHLASSKGCKLLILQRTFSSLAGAAQANYPLFPVRYLMSNQYPSLEKIRRYHGPLFQSHGTVDTLIPIRMARDLFAAAPTVNKKFLAIEGMGHFDRLPESYWHELKSFAFSAAK